jgi:hypothetical protein
MYLAAPSLTPRIIGVLDSCAADKTAFIHSKLLILICATANFSTCAFLSIVNMLTSGVAFFFLNILLLIFTRRFLQGFFL